MDLRALTSKLWIGRGSVQTLAGGKLVERSYPELAQDIDSAVSKLRQWGVTTGMRVGIYAQNSYEWLVHDLALIELDAILVPFTRDFLGALDEDLFARHKLSLVLTSQEMAGQIASRHLSGGDG